MNILDELGNKFTEVLNEETLSSSRHHEVTEEFNEFCKQLSPEQASEADEITGRMLSVDCNLAFKAGMKVGARIVAGLLDDS